ncbi:heme ABC transporter permease CcmC [Mesosutterella sp. OilRF-GAM-744-9]|uniref:Heme exporter protein C n=1 Tax=Mesosutterella porci TaxID=2915351 RepID=A0ABS9MSX3_9BURK|nr:heme ABC transporter permease CcmC [Mesosutterella sp. oilRF-744-WT-GAM-9]MCG5031429.1 heme ABC transporter permease CcmC [Mesosutterella sp. oilRF-744-WT-GAM-9]MCI6530955.1 heme ABC transporter permease CcmC [Mesosutterella sp.]
MSFPCFTDPERFYKSVGPLAKGCFAVSLVLFAVGFYMGFFVTPIDYRQGNSYRIIFMHIPAAWMSLFIYVMMALYTVWGLVTRSKMAPAFAVAMAPTGALMGFIALFTGSMWGRPTWGTYWVWDARLTSMLILFFLYLGYIALHEAIDDYRKADRAAAVIAIVGALNVPVIYFSVRWWNTLHQGASITTRGTSMETTMFYTVLIMVAALWIYCTGAVLERTRTEVLRRCRREPWARAVALQGDR